MIIPNIWKNKNVPNHQPDEFLTQKKGDSSTICGFVRKKRVFDHDTYMETWCCQDATENKWSYEHLQQ